MGLLLVEWIALTSSFSDPLTFGFFCSFFLCIFWGMDEYHACSCITQKSHEPHILDCD